MGMGVAWGVGVGKDGGWWVNIPSAPVLSSTFLFLFWEAGIGQPPATHPNSPTHRSPPHLVQAQGCFFQFCSYLKTQMIKLINIQLVAGRVGFDRCFFFFLLFSEADLASAPERQEINK